MNALKANFWEIDRSPILNHFGALLSVLHILNYFYWRSLNHFAAGENSAPLLCWEFFTSCAQTVSTSSAWVHTLFTSYLIFSILSLVAFAWRRFVGISWSLLFLVSFIHIFFYVLDASLNSDAQALLIFLELCFLFVPGKLPLIRYSVLTFYIISAWRELNPDWLSGASMMTQISLPLKGLEWLAAIGILIKCTLPFLLTSPFGQRLTWAVLGLIGFHGFHFYFKHDFESLMLGLIVLFFILDYFERIRQERESYYQSYAHPEPSKLWWPMAMTVFVLAQTPVLSAHWPTQILRIEGPAASIECQHTTFVRIQNKIEVRDDLISEDIKAQFRCHPLMAFNAAKMLCQKLKENPELQSVASYFQRRRLSEVDFKNYFSIENICSDDVTYKNAVKVQP